MSAVFTFHLGQPLSIAVSGEQGTVEARSESATSEPQYLLRYEAADGRAVEAWWTQSALQAEEADVMCPACAQSAELARFEANASGKLERFLEETPAGREISETTLSDLLVAYGVPVNEHTRIATAICSRTLARLGWTRTRARQPFSTCRSWVYVRPAAEPAMPQLQPPAICTIWSAQGGIYAGIVRGAEGQPDQHVILSAALPTDKLAWQPAMDWAAAHTEGAHTDWSLPTRAISSLLLANLRDQFGAGWYWTSEQHSPDDAWGQDFDDGYQFIDPKSYLARARAVRRFNVQSLIHS